MKGAASHNNTDPAASAQLPGDSEADTVERRPPSLLDAPPTAARRPVPVRRTAQEATWMLESHEHMQTRIINGSNDSGPARFPFAARLKWQLAANASKRCTGSLIARSHILTSAHVSRLCRLPLHCDAMHASLPSLRVPTLPPSLALLAQCLHFKGRRALPEELAVWVGGEWINASALLPHEGAQAQAACRQLQPVLLCEPCIASAPFKTFAAPSHAPAGYDPQGGLNCSSSSGARHDIAIVALARPSAAPTVRLPAAAEQDVPAAGTTVWAAGFGKTESGQASDVLR